MLVPLTQIKLTTLHSEKAIIYVKSKEKSFYSCSLPACLYNKRKLFYFCQGNNSNEINLWLILLIVPKEFPPYLNSSYMLSSLSPSICLWPLHCVFISNYFKTVSTFLDALIYLWGNIIISFVKLNKGFAIFSKYLRRKYA